MASCLGDLQLRFAATTWLEQAHYWRGEYERLVELANNNVAALPADRVNAYFSNVAPASIHDRGWMVLGLAQLGRFAEAAERQAEMIRLAAPLKYTYTVTWAHLTAAWLCVLKGDWPNARSSIEHVIELLRDGNVVSHISPAVACSSWILAQLGETIEAHAQLGEGEKHLEKLVAGGSVGYLGWTCHSLGRASLLLNRIDDAQRLGVRAVEASPCQYGFRAYALHLLGDVAAHPQRFDPERSEAQYRKALALAELRGMKPLVAHCHLGLGKLYRRAGERRAPEHLVTAATMYSGMDMKFWLAQVEMHQLE